MLSTYEIVEIDTEAIGTLLDQEQIKERHRICGCKS